MADKGQGPAQRGRAVGSRRSTSARVAEKIQQKIRDKEYYEAHQTYRALYQRFKAQSKESDALDLLYNGTLLLLEHHQVSWVQLARKQICSVCGNSIVGSIIYLDVKGKGLSLKNTLLNVYNYDVKGSLQTRFRITGGRGWPFFIVRGRGYSV